MLRSGRAGVHRLVPSCGCTAVSRSHHSERLIEGDLRLWDTAFQGDLVDFFKFYFGGTGGPITHRIAYRTRADCAIRIVEAIAAFGTSAIPGGLKWRFARNNWG